MPPDALTAESYRFQAGSTPLLVSMPHVGTALEPCLAERMTDAGRRIADTDWHVDRLYDFAGELGAGVIAAVQSRYVIDLNRPPDGRPLYPGASETGLCPTESFAGEPLYLPGEAPTKEEVGERRARSWQPYHDRLRRELATLRARHGVALLWDAHSIRSRLPRFFEGRLPDLNFGSGGGISADPALLARLAATAGRSAAFSHVVDGRFKGGYITRHYGDPAAGIHAVQLELAQITYMDEEPPFGFDAARAGRLRPLLRRLLETMLQWSETARAAAPIGSTV